MCFRCVFPDANSLVSCYNGDIVGPAVGIIACYQANEAIKLLTGINSVNALTQIDTLNNITNTYKISSDKYCINNHCDYPTTLKIKHIKWPFLFELASLDKIKIIDIRQIKNNNHALPGSIQCTEDNIPLLKLPFKQPIAVVCNFGYRSKLIALKFSRLGYEEVYYTSLL